MPAEKTGRWQPGSSLRLPGKAKPYLWIYAGLIALGIGAAALFFYPARTSELAAFLRTLDGQGAWLGTPQEQKHHPGVQLEMWQAHRTYEWIAKHQPAHVVDNFAPQPLGDDLFVPGWIGRNWVVYRADQPPRLSTVEARAFAELARHLLAGKPMPDRTLMPTAYTRPYPVEVMVTLRHLATDRLWRSAKGNSLIESLAVAAHAARLRWAERERAMGAPLDQILHALDIDVSILAPRGIYVHPDLTWLAYKIVGVGRWGLGIEKKDAWYYRFAPKEAFQSRSQGRALLDQLLKTHGIRHDALGRPDVRLYRFEAIRLGTSPKALQANQ